MSSHAPFSAQILLNGHECTERQAQKAGLSFAKEGNCFTHLGNANRFAKFTETGIDPSIVERLTAVCDPRGPAGFARSSINGWTPFAPSGRSARRASVSMGNLCSWARERRCVRTGRPAHEAAPCLP